MEDGCVPEEPHAEETTEPQAGTPKPVPDRPTGAWQIFRRPAPAHLHDRDFVSLLHQAKGRNAAAEARADNNEVEIELLVATCHRFPIATFQISCERCIHEWTVPVFFCPRTLASITCPIFRNASALGGESSPNNWKS